jgi:hypothetical protein
MIRSFLTSFIAFICVVVFTVVSLFSAFLSMISDRELYTERLVDFAYDDLLEILPAYFDLGDFSPYFSEDDVGGILKQVLTREDFDAFAADLVSQFDELEVSENSEIEFVFDLSLIEDKQGEMLLIVMDSLFENLPACAGDELESIPCVPESIAKEDFNFYVDNHLRNKFLTGISEEFFFSMPVPSDVEGSVPDYFRQAFRYALAMNLLFVAALFFFLGLSVFSPMQKILLIESITLLIGSFIVMLISVGLRKLGNLHLNDPLGESVVGFLSGEVSAQLFPWALGFCVLSIVGIASYIYLNRRDESL